MKNLDFSIFGLFLFCLQRELRVRKHGFRGCPDRISLDFLNKNACFPFVSLINPVQPLIEMPYSIKDFNGIPL